MRPSLSVSPGSVVQQIDATDVVFQFDGLASRTLVLCFHLLAKCTLVLLRVRIESLISTDFQLLFQSLDSILVRRIRDLLDQLPQVCLT